MLALIEEVKSDDGDNASKRRRRGSAGGRGRNASARRTVIGDSTNTTPPSSKLLPHGGGRRHVHRSVAKARKNNANSRSDADLLEEALAYSRTGPPVPSPRRVSVVAVKTTAGGVWGQRRGGGAREKEKAEIRATAAALLRLLIVEKQDKMSTHFHKIPFMPQLPDLPSLGEVGAVLSRELGYQSLGEQLGRLTPLLKDESTEVNAGGRGGGVYRTAVVRQCASDSSAQWLEWTPQRRIHPLERDNQQSCVCGPLLRASLWRQRR